MNDRIKAVKAILRQRSDADLDRFLWRSQERIRQIKNGELKFLGEGNRLMLEDDRKVIVLVKQEQKRRRK